MIVEQIINSCSANSIGNFEIIILNQNLNHKIESI
jgi:hypothetical protein